MGPHASVRLTNMKSAITLILGLSMVMAATGCDDGGGETDDGGPKAVSGAGNNSSGNGTVLPGAGSGSGGSDSGTGGSGGSGSLPEGVALPAADGWVDMGSNNIGVQ